MAIKFKDIPDEFIKKIVHDLKSYTVSLHFDNKLLGSGTLVKCNGRYGILTARHVLSRQTPPIEIRPTFDESFIIPVENKAHWFSLPFGLLEEIVIAEPKSDEFGPDLTFIEIKISEKLGTLKAKRAFWDIGVRSEEKITQCLSGKGITMFFGSPDEINYTEKSAEEIRIDSFCLGVLGSLSSTKVFERGDYDYFEQEANYREGIDLPSSFGGMSGGGLWCLDVGFKEKT